jgi:hypothetical protein
LFLSTRFDSSSSDKDVLLAAVAKGVGKSNGDQIDNDNKGDDEDDKEVLSTGKNLMRILGLSVFHQLLEFMLFKITILNVTI